MQKITCSNEFESSPIESCSVQESGNEDISSKVAILTRPLSLGGTSMIFEQGYKQESLLSRILNLFKSISPGSDLTKFQLPPQFNLPKSQLQLFGESAYCSSTDLLSKCVEGETPLERLKAVVAWSISTVRPPIFGKAPYNPILGETHHVSSGHLNVLVEQVSHHPPITALHATHEAKNIELTWWQQPVPRLYGGSVETTISGKRIMRLLAFGENYEMNCPRLSIKFFPTPCMEWIGPVSIQCKESGLEASLTYKGKSLFGLKGPSTRLYGKIYQVSTAYDFYELEGNWDQTVTLKDVRSGNTSLLYDAKATIAKLKTPIVQNLKDLSPTESSVVWATVSEGILRKDWLDAKEAKRKVEEQQRSSAKKRENEGKVWNPKYFRKTEDGGWEWLHPSHLIPSAPIVVP